MAMHIRPTPVVFQQTLNPILEWLPAVKIIAHDIFIVGEGNSNKEVERDHDSKLYGDLQ